jgi:hypothetical protein
MWVVVRVVLAILGLSVTPVLLLFVYVGVDTALLVILSVRGSDEGRLRPVLGEWLALAAGIVVLVLLGSDKLANENFSGDGVEAYGFASSLQSHPLPEWDLENGTWGFYPAFMSFAYPLQLSLITGGESEASARLPVVVFTMGICAFFIGTRARAPSAVVRALATVLLVVTSGWNYSYDPYFADIAEPTVTDLFFSLCLVGAVWCWQQRNFSLFLLTASLAMTALPAGLPFLSLLLVLGIFVGGRRAWDLRALAVMFSMGLVLMILARLVNPIAPSKFSPAIFLTHHTKTFLDQLGPRQIMTQLWVLLIQSGGVPVLFAAAFLRRLRRPGEDRVVLLATLIYLASVVLSPKRHPHYLTPVVVLLVFQAPVRPERVTWFWCVLLLPLISGVLPNPRPQPDQRTRDFGEATLMVFSNERDAIDNADLLYSVLTIPPWRTESNWGPGKHAWVLYSAVCDQRPNAVPPGTHLLFSERPQPWDGFDLVTDNGTSFLYEQPAGWLKEQNRIGGCTSCWGPLLKIPFLLWDPLSRWRA